MFNSALLFELAILKGHLIPILEQVKENSPAYSEAYRLNKHPFVEALQQKGCRMAVAILYLDKQHHSFVHLQARLKKLMQAIITKEFEQ